MSDVNPYAAPDESYGVATDAAGTIAGMEIASQNRRFCNFFVDNIVVRILATVGGIAVGTAFAASRGGQVAQSDMLTLQILGAVVGVLVAVGYYVFFEAAFGVTIAKLLTGTKVIRDDGTTPGFGQIVGRSFARMIPFEPLSFLFGDKTTGWHDSLSGTRVVRKN